LHNHELDHYILPRWGKINVDEVRIIQLRDWFAATAKDNDLTFQSVQKMKQIFGRLYAYGAENELIAPTLNPVRSCNIKGIGKKSRSQVIVVSPQVALKIAMALSPMHKTLVLTAAGTGMRISELLGLQWRDIDWTAKRLNLRRTWLG